MSDNFKFNQNRACEYFPCHKNIEAENFNCTFCYCPLYALGERCGGNFRYTPKGIKDCTNCIKPHQRENYDQIIEKLKLVVEMTRKKNYEKEQE
jgi:Zn-finger protein